MVRLVQGTLVAGQLEPLKEASDGAREDVDKSVGRWAARRGFVYFNSNTYDTLLFDVNLFLSNLCPKLVRPFCKLILSAVPALPQELADGGRVSEALVHGGINVGSL
jgi:hypothetical protein